VIEGDDRVGALASVMDVSANAKIQRHRGERRLRRMNRYGAIFWVKPRDVAKTASAVGAI